MAPNGKMEDVGATYPVCDECGAIGSSRTKDGDDCAECVHRASAQPARLPGGAS